MPEAATRTDYEMRTFKINGCGSCVNSCLVGTNRVEFVTLLTSAHNSVVVGVNHSGGNYTPEGGCNRMCSASSRRRWVTTERKSEQVPMNEKDLASNGSISLTQTDAGPSSHLCMTIAMRNLRLCQFVLWSSWRIGVLGLRAAIIRTSVRLWLQVLCLIRHAFFVRTNPTKISIRPSAVKRTGSQFSAYFPKEGSDVSRKSTVRSARFK